MFTDLQSWTSYLLLSQHDLLNNNQPVPVVSAATECRKGLQSFAESSHIIRISLFNSHIQVNKKGFFLPNVRMSCVLFTNNRLCSAGDGGKEAALCAAVLNKNNSRNTFYGCKHGRRITFLALGDHNRRISCRPMRQQRRNIPPPSV